MTKTVRALTSEAEKRRAVRSEATRLKLINVAARIIGRRGYAGCTIARVTAAAKIAHGTFYSYFESQQALFDQVIVVLGQQMVENVVGQIHEPDSVRDLEAQYLKASLAYLAKHPYMFEVVRRQRIETGRRNPGFHEYSFERYTIVLRPLVDACISDNDLQVLARMIMNLRSTIFQAYKGEGGKLAPPTQEMLDVYCDFASAGIDAAIARLKAVASADHPSKSTAILPKCTWASI